MPGSKLWGLRLLGHLIAETSTLAAQGPYLLLNISAGSPPLSPAGNELLGTLPEGGYLHRLTALDLSGNRFGRSLPRSLAPATQLRALALQVGRSPPTTQALSLSLSRRRWQCVGLGVLAPAVLLLPPDVPTDLRRMPQGPKQNMLSPPSR